MEKYGIQRATFLTKEVAVLWNVSTCDLEWGTCDARVEKMIYEVMFRMETKLFAI